MKLKRGTNRGITREVILIGAYAIKIPSVRSWWFFLEGLQCNINETNRSNQYEHFCPVIFSVPGGFLNVMPRCEEFKEYQFALMHDLFYKLDDFHSVVENKQSSFGMLNDELVAVDYG